MSESESPPEKPVALDYFGPQAEAPRSETAVAIWFGVSTAFIVAFTGFIWVINNLHLRPSFPSYPTNWKWPVVTGLIGIFVIAAMFVTAWQKGQKARAAAICIAFGLSLLVEGICFGRNV